MSAGNRNIGKITKDLYDTLVASGYEIFTTRPESVPDSLDKFIVVNVPARVIDLLGYARTVGRVSLYARSKKYNGYIIEDIATLQSMQDKIYSYLPIKTDNYIIGNPTSINLGGDNTGFYVWHINLDITIK